MKQILVYFILAAFCQMISEPCLHAEVVMDGSTGAFGQLETANGNYDIKMKYGHQAGTNLFHSFSKFNISTGESATFGVSESIRNIISRITGGNQSFIDGTLRSVLTDTSQISGANLYLLNSSGIIFGPNAALDIGGSFHVSTADYLRMGADERFYSTVQENEVLSSAPPEAFGFLKSPEDISFEGRGEIGEDIRTGLTVSPLHNLSVTGGDISFAGTYRTEGSVEKNLGSLGAPGGTVAVVSLSSPGEVTFSETGPDVSAFSTLGNVTLSDHSQIRASGIGSGNIFIRAGQFVLENESVIDVDTKGSENGGITDIQADTVSISAGDIFSDATSTGRGGDISISGIGGKPAKSVTVSDGGRVFANATNQAADAGDAGNVSIFSEKLTISSGGKVSSSADGGGNGGIIRLNALESVLITDQESEVFASSSGTSEIPGRSGSGDILIESPEINLTGSSKISIDTANGAGGTLILRGLDGKPSESITVSDSQIYAGTLGSGNAGDVLMQAERIRFEEKGFIGSETFGSGTGGNIRIEAGDTFELADGAYISSNSKENAAGNAGNISVWAGDSVYLRNSTITTETEGSGAGGNIRIEAGNVFELFDGAYISSNSKGGTGNAGNISVQAGDSIYMRDSSITTEALNAGGGKISLESQNMIYTIDSRVATSVAKGADDAGDISVDPLSDFLEFIVMNRSELRANAYEGKGGNIRIETDQFVSSGTSVVDASSQLGIDGTVNIISPEADVSQGLVKLSTSLLDAAQWTQTPCFQRSGADVSTFIFTGQDAVPNPPDDLQIRNPLFWEQAQ